VNSCFAEPLRLGDCFAQHRDHPGKLGWGIVDAILGLVLLPIGASMLLIEGLVNGATWLLGGMPKRAAAIAETFADD